VIWNGIENALGSVPFVCRTSMPSDSPEAASTRTAIEYASGAGWRPTAVIWPLTAPFTRSGR
jgi:hypothetical protein